MIWPARRSIRDPCLSGKRPLMVRYYLLRTPWLAVQLHHLLRSDNGEADHDHPWPFVSFLLSGGYWECTPAGRFWRRRFSVLVRPASWMHHIELTRPVWTIVLRGRDRGAWGFYTAAGWVPFLDYYRNCK